jgi:hypothetical protein
MIPAVGKKMNGIQVMIMMAMKCLIQIGIWRWHVEGEGSGKLLIWQHAIGGGRGGNSDFLISNLNLQFMCPLPALLVQSPIVTCDKTSFSSVQSVCVMCDMNQWS